MENLVPLGTGNSRLMKSNIPASTTLAQLIQMWNNGTFPYDIGPLNSAGISQQGTPLNKDTLLKDATAALFGLGTDAVPDDVLEYLGKYNQYWWKRTNKGVYQEAEGAAISLIYSNSWTTSSEGSVQYSSSVTVNPTTGEITLSNPISTVTIDLYGNDGFDSNANILKGKYFIPLLNGANATYVAYMEQDAIMEFQFNAAQNYPARINVTNGKCHIVTSQIVPGDTTLVYSSNRNAYPDSGESGGFEYQYLGIPFENAITAPKIATGSYVGTGKYGASNPNTLTFDFEPKLVLCANNLFDYAGTNQFGFMWFGQDGGQAQGSKIFSLSGNTLSWYHNTSASNQANQSGATFKYVAIG